jgi:hypothetical protein
MRASSCADIFGTIFGVLGRIRAFSSLGQTISYPWTLCVPAPVINIPNASSYWNLNTLSRQIHVCRKDQKLDNLNSLSSVVELACGRAGVQPGYFHLEHAMVYSPVCGGLGCSVYGVTKAAGVL